MKKSKQSKLDALLKVEFTMEDSLWLSSGYTLRRLVGILGMALPLLLFFFLYLDSGLIKPLPSISHYYFTRVSGIFLIILGTTGIFLMVYKGHKPIDFYISLFAGLFALVLLLFPTSNLAVKCCDPDKTYTVTYLKDIDIRAVIHYISAAIFLLCLAYMSLFLFTKSNLPPAHRGAKKRIRNRIFRTCGVIIFLSIIVILLGFLEIIPPEVYDKCQMTFWMETIAVESFGFSWLIKGRTLFKDKSKS